MAGGFGLRLRPLTESLPKPMLLLGERPLLERTLESLARAGVRDKPRLDFLISAGIYALEPEALTYVPRDEYFDMPDLIAALLADHGDVAKFPLLEYWADIGTISDYARAQVDVEKGRA